VEHAELHAEISLIRDQGYATGLEELEIGLNAVSAPIRDHTGRVIAALSTAGPAYRLSEERIEEVLRQLVLDFAKQISLEFGYVEKNDTTAESNP
jgi:DNA-binding IclR family transcriptional regulator